MGALGIPSAADIERLTRRMRSVSQRLEGIEDTLDRLDERLAALGDRLQANPADHDHAALEGRLDELAADVAALREALAPAAQVPRTQERLAVTESQSPGSRRRAASTTSS
jgi:chromosome segregation ATPase